MSYLDSAQEGYDGRYAIFASPNVETATKRELITEYRPVSHIKSTDVIEFNVPNSSLYYMDLSRSRLCIKLRILNGEKPVEELKDQVALINNALHSVWNKVDVALNQTPVGSDIGPYYPYKAILDALLFTSPSELESKDQTTLFFKDTAGSMDSASIENVNKGLFRRYSYTCKGGEVQLEGVLNHDIMKIKSFIPNGVGLNLKLTPSRNEFILMSESTNEEYEIEITDALLKIQYVEPTSSLLIGHAEAFEKSPAIFPYSKSVVKCFTIPAFVQNWSIDTLFANEIPDNLIIGMVDSEAFTGSLTKNPFNFQHFDLTNLTFYIEGHPMNTASFSPNFDKNHYTSEYLSLFEKLNDEETVKGVGGMIDYSEFGSGYAIFKINISEGLQKNFTSLCHRGQTRLKFRFQHPLPKPITIVCYGKVSSVLQIDKTKSVISY